jgi:hypothetical protein
MNPDEIKKKYANLGGSGTDFVNFIEEVIEPLGRDIDVVEQDLKETAALLQRLLTDLKPLIGVLSFFGRLWPFKKKAS